MQFSPVVRKPCRRTVTADEDGTRNGCNRRRHLANPGLVMAPTHHPSGQALANFLVGDCSPGASLLIARHVTLCAQCSSRVRAMGSVGVEPPLISFGEPESLAPGLEIEIVEGVSGLGEAVYRVRAAPSLSLPQHQPGPAVEILVLEGEFEGDGVVYGPGDYLSLEESPKQRLLSSPARGCIYLKATHVPVGLPAD